MYLIRATCVICSWNTCVKLVWNFPRSTHNYFVENLLSEGFPSVRRRILGQYVNFLQRLRKSVSSEVRIMSFIAAADVRSTNGRNCYNLSQEFNLDPWTSSPSLLKEKYSFYEVPDADSWRLPLLTTLLHQRYDMNACGDDTRTVDGLIESLCSS